MNRSLLLVVCDFLLLSILALARFDVPEGAVIAQDDQKVVSKEVVERISDGENYDDVVAELEATNETLLENLSSDNDTLVQQKLELEEQIAQRKKELEEKEREIESRDAVIAGNEEAIKEAKQEAEELEAQREEIERKREELMKNNAASQKELELLARNLAEAKRKSDELAALKEKTQREAESVKVELAATQEKAKAEEKAAAEAKAMLLAEKRRSDALVESTSKIDQKIDSLNQGLEGVGKDLKVVGQGLAGVGEKISSVTEEVSNVKKDVSRVGEEMAGVKETVVGVSEEVAGVGDQVESIKKEVEETAAVQQENFRKLNDRQVRSVNEIFTRYDENKIRLKLNFVHQGGFLGAQKEETFSMDTIIMLDGSFAYSLVHAKESPFRLSPRPRKLVSVSGEITSPKLKAPIPVKEIAFMDDPRILIVPLYLNPVTLKKESSIEIFEAPTNPYLFSEAVVVDAKQGRFGQTDFIRDEKDSRYIKVKHNHFAFITGSFDPGKGDLVFSQKGELLGIMVNNDYAFHVKNLGSRIHGGSRTILGDSFAAEKTNGLLSSLSKKLFGLNNKFR
ncbi:MAG: hypothetical protein CMI33_09015 [Opitutales bacterium]|nr:hypothetical protein [Opitutales bacterium]